MTSNGLDIDLKNVLKYQQTGDLKYVAAVFEAYYPLIFGTCLKYIKDVETSKDITMNIFEKLQKELKTSKIQNFKSWLYVLVKNECLMELRKNKRIEKHLEEFEKEATVDMEFDSVWHPYDEDQDGITRMMLNTCLKKLPDEQNQTIQLFYLDKKSYLEISSMLNFEVKSIKSYLQNGRRNLKKCLERSLKRIKVE